MIKTKTIDYYLKLVVILTMEPNIFLGNTKNYASFEITLGVTAGYYKDANSKAVLLINVDWMSYYLKFSPRKFQITRLSFIVTCYQSIICTPISEKCTFADLIKFDRPLLDYAINIKLFFELAGKMLAPLI